MGYEKAKHTNEARNVEVSLCDVSALWDNYFVLTLHQTETYMRAIVCVSDRIRSLLAVTLCWILQSVLHRDGSSAKCPGRDPRQCHYHRR